MLAPDLAANSNVTLLAALVGFGDKEESEFRFLVDGLHGKYVTVNPGVLPVDDRTFTPTLLAALLPFPPGDWNEGRVSKDAETGHPVFVDSKRSDLRVSATHGTTQYSIIWN